MSDLEKLTADLLAAGPKAEAASYAALRFEAHKMRDDWRAAVGGGGFRGATVALDYDIVPTGLRSITAEVGYSKRGQGNVGNILEYGTSSQGPIRPAGKQVLQGGADRLEKYLGGLDPL